MRISALLAALALISAAQPLVIHAQDECTVALIAGSATVDGRPLLMKSRDVTNDAQEFVFGAGNPYDYISVTYAGMANQVFGGVNEVGFAILNANAWNFDDQVSGPDDDGYIILEALSSCATVADFAAIMDSTDDEGRTRPAVYGVIDASGAGAFFEAAAYVHYVYDLADTTAAPNGYMVRANYAYSGSSYHLGQHRHDRALMILDSAYAAGGISRNLLFQRVLRELVNEEVNPYPLPFRGVDGGLSYGLLHTHDAINRDITRSAYVVEGVLTAEDPLLATVWAMAGEPICSAALPLWVKAGSVPVEFDGPSGSTLNLQARAYKSYLYVNGVSHDVLDTWRLVDERNLGLYPFLISLENQAFARGDSALTVWRAQGLPAAAEVSNLQNSIASWALTQQSVWGPPAAPQVTITRLPNNRVQLNWSQVTQDVFGRPISVAQYAIYGSEEPFYDRETGALIDVVSGLTYTLNVTDAVKFLQVRALVSP